jgi:hypothetical protein
MSAHEIRGHHFMRVYTALLIHVPVIPTTLTRISFRCTNERLLGTVATTLACLDDAVS